MAPLAGAAIAVAGLLAYCNSLHGPFVFDDPPSIAGNPTIRHLWPVWDALRPPHGNGITVGGRPVLNLSLAVNYAVSGTRVWSYHALNLLIHILAGLTLFGVVRRTLDAGRNPTILASTPSGSAVLPAFSIALLWIVHPLQAESVTYIIQRAESLMGLFYLLTLYCFVRAAAVGIGRERWQMAWYALSIAFCLLGMGTKEVMATAPVVVFLYDRTFLAGGFRAAWRMRRGYYLALASTWALLGALVAGGGGNRSGSMGLGVGPWPRYLLGQLSAISRYLQLVVWPHPLVIDYGAPQLANPAELLPKALLVLTLLGATLWALRRHPPAGFLGACFFLILAPTSLMPSATEVIVEHRMYLPLATILGLIVCAGFAAAGRRFLLAAMAIAIVLGALTFRRNVAYETDLALWTDTVANCPGSSLARNNLALDLAAAGKTREAILQFEESIRINPEFAQAHNNLGTVLDEAGRIHEAAEQYRDALRINPTYAKALNNLGITLEETGQIGDAVLTFRRALRLDPGNLGFHENLAGALRAAGRFAEARAEFAQAAQIRTAMAESK